MGPDEDSLPETLANSTMGRERELSSCATNHHRLRRTTPTETWKGLRPFPSQFHNTLCRQGAQRLLVTIQNSQTGLTFRGAPRACASWQAMIATC